VCGLRVSLTAAKQIRIFAGHVGSQQNLIVPTAGLDTGMHNLVVAEQKNGQGLTTTLRVYVDGIGQGSITMGGTGDVFGIVNDTITLIRAPGSQIDEVTLWPQDVSATTEMLCENGFDGQYDPVSDRCLTTSN